MVKLSLAILEQRLVNIVLLLRELQVLDLDHPLGQHHDRVAVLVLGGLCAAQYQGLEYGGDHLHGLVLILGLERDRDEGAPEREVGPGLGAKEVDQGEQVLELVLDRSAGHDPATGRVDGVAGLGRLGQAALDLMCLIQDHAVKIN